MVASRTSVHDDAIPVRFEDVHFATLADEMRDIIRRRSISLHARLRVADALYALALDILGDETLSDADRSWLRQQIAGPVTEATEEALAVLTQELSTALRSAPPGVRPSIMATAPISRTDFE